MAIIGIKSLNYGVDNVPECARFFDDFGLRAIRKEDAVCRFKLPEGSEVVIRHRDDPALPVSSLVGDGVREVIWGVDTQESLDAIVVDLSRDRDVTRAIGWSRTLCHGLRHRHGLGCIYARADYLCA